MTAAGTRATRLPLTSPSCTPAAFSSPAGPAHKKPGDMMEGRREFMLGLAATAAATGCTTTAPHDAPMLPATTGLATDTAYWNAVRALYQVAPEIVNLENG